MLLPLLATSPLFLAATAATSILALTGGNLVFGIGGDKYKCFGLAATITAIASIAAAAALFSLRECKFI